MTPQSSGLMCVFGAVQGHKAKKSQVTCPESQWEWGTETQWQRHAAFSTPSPFFLLCFYLYKLRNSKRTLRRNSEKYFNPQAHGGLSKSLNSRLPCSRQSTAASRLPRLTFPTECSSAPKLPFLFYQFCSFPKLVFLLLSANRLFKMPARTCLPEGREGAWRVF